MGANVSYESESALKYQYMLLAVYRKDEEK